MFIGHYSAAFLLKAKEPKASLPMLFIAVQFVDILFFPFALLGIERLQLIEKYNAVNNYYLEYMPFTHGLLGSFIWAVFWYLLYKFIVKQQSINSSRVAMIMAFGVLSHWFADLIAHTPDLPIIDGEPKFGLGLWKNKELTFVVESLLLGLSIYYYLLKSGLVGSRKKIFSIGFGLFLILIQFFSFYVLPQETKLLPLAISALLSYFLFSGMAFWVERKELL